MLLLVLGVLAVLNLIASGTANSSLEWATKPFLMPVLALWLWRVRPRAKGIIAGVLFSAAGDIALLNGGKQSWFIAGMVFFLCAHVCYIVSFVRGGARLRPVTVAAYAAVLTAALAWLWKPLGDMAIPMTGYGVALATMGTLAASLGWRIGLGGALFVLSDLLIAIRVAEAATIPGPPIWVMLTYISAQVLIATGWAARPPR